MSEKAAGLVFVVGFCGFFAVMGVFGLRDLVWEAGLARESPGWPTVPGEVVDVSVSRSRQSTRIVYQYRVAERTYENRRIAFVDRARGRTRSEMADQYPEGREVTVHYDPDDPALAVLETGATTWMIAKDGLVGGGFVLLGLGAGVAGVVAVARD